MELYRIRNWSTLFENNRTRELKRIDWVPVPNRMDSLGYLTLVDHPNGAAHLGAWLAILEIASRRFPKEDRGTLPHDGAGLPQALARISRLPAELFAEVLPRLTQLQWIEQYSEIPQLGAGFPQDDAARMRVGMEGNLREEKGIESDEEQTKPWTGTPSQNPAPPSKMEQACELLMLFPGAKLLPGMPDEKIQARCLLLAGDDVESLARALRTLHLSGKRAEVSWMWFPTVLKQYLEPKIMPRRAATA